VALRLASSLGLLLALVTRTARARALERAADTANRLCRDFGAGTVCGFEGQAECRLEEKRQTETESCR